MGSAGRHHRFSLEEYLDFELDHEEKYEFADGAILAMAGAGLRHNAVAMNVLAALHGRLAGRCVTLGSDQRVATPDGLHIYPDGLVVCGPMEASRYKGTATLHNPAVLVEVLSPSTRDYDLGEKLERYQAIPSLRHVLLLETDRPEVLHVRREAEGWSSERLVTLDDVIRLLDVEIGLADVYRDLPEA